MKRRKAIDKVLGNNILVRRTSLGLSRQQLAEKLTITHQQIHKYEMGHNRVAASRLFDIAKIFECTTDELLSYKSEPMDSNKIRRSINLVTLYYKLTDKQKDAVLEIVRLFGKEDGQ